MRHPAPEEPQPIHVRMVFLRKIILHERFESLAIPLNRVRVPIAGKRFGRSEHADECKECGIVGDCRWNSAEENLTEIGDRSLYLRINGPLRLRHRNRGVLTTNAVRTDPRESRERNGLMLADNETQLIAGFRGLDARDARARAHARGTIRCAGGVPSRKIAPTVKSVRYVLRRSAHSHAASCWITCCGR